MSNETWPQLRRRQIEERIAMVTQAVQNHGGNRSAAARSLNMDRRALLRVIERYALDVPPPMPCGPPAGVDKRNQQSEGNAQ